MAHAWNHAKGNEACTLYRLLWCFGDYTVNKTKFIHVNAFWNFTVTSALLASHLWAYCFTAMRKNGGGVTPGLTRTKAGRRGSSVSVCRQNWHNNNFTISQWNLTLWQLILDQNEKSVVCFFNSGSQECETRINCNFKHLTLKAECFKIICLWRGGGDSGSGVCFFLNSLFQ